MVIQKLCDGTKLTVMPIGRLDATTAPDLDNYLKESLSDMTELVFDFSQLEYISSAGLRILLIAQKKMTLQGSMVIRNISEPIKEIFEITGFGDILSVE